MPIGRVGHSVTLVRPLFRSLAAPASGLSAQRARIDAIATNIANAETTRTEEGGPYRRRVVELEAQSRLPRGMGIAKPVLPHTTVPVPGIAFDMPEFGPLAVASRPDTGAGGVRVVGIAEDPSEGPLVYDPGHPDADETGYVRYPNVNITEEMVELLEARRVYEANATVFDAVKAMLRRASEI